MGASNYLANKILDHIFQRSDDIDLGVGVWLALSTTEPNDDGTGVSEPSGDNYSRVLIGYYGQTLTYKMDAAVAGVTTNGDAIQFPEVRDGSGTGDWGTITHYAMYDAETGGNMLISDALSASISAVDGKVPLVRAGDLYVSLS